MVVVISLGIRSLEDFIKDPIVTAFINNLLHLFQLPFPVALLLLLALELVGLDPFKSTTLADEHQNQMIFNNFLWRNCNCQASVK